MELDIKQKTWFEFEGKPVFGKGRYQLLKNIHDTNSMKLAAKNMGICEKTAHNYVRKMESRLNKKIIKTYKGGKNAGGSTKLTAFGKFLVRKWEQSV